MDTGRIQQLKITAILVLLIGGIGLWSCGGSQTGLSDVTPQPTAPQTNTTGKLTAEWLSAQPGRRIGEFSFHLLAADGSVIADWPGLSVTGNAGAGTAGFTLAGTAAAPDDAYLYVVYDSGRYAYQHATLSAAARDEYISLIVPGRIENVLAVGLARAGGAARHQRDHRRAARDRVRRRVRAGGACDQCRQ